VKFPRQGINRYLEDIGQHPVLCEEAQLLHCRRIHQWLHPDLYPEQETPARIVEKRGRHSMNMMVTTNLRMVVTVAKRFQQSGMEFIDLVQEGNLGLIRGLELYDPARGYRISTYAYWWIRQGITRAIHNNGRMIRLPISNYEVINKVTRFEHETAARTGKIPTLEEMAAHADVTVERLKFILESYAITNIVSLDLPVPHANRGGKYGHECYILDSIAAPEPPEDDTPTDFTDTAELSPQQLAVRQALAQLVPKERYVMEEIILQGKSLQEVADYMQLSKSRIGQLLKSAKGHMQSWLEANEVSENN